MGKNSYRGGSTVIRPGSSWFSKSKKKPTKRPIRTNAQRRAAQEAEATEKHERQVMIRLRQKRLAAEQRKLSPKVRKQLRMIEETALRAKAEKKRKHEETIRLLQESKSAQKQARQEQARLRQEKTAAEKTARKSLHQARTQAVRLSKVSLVGKGLGNDPSVVLESKRTVDLRQSRKRDPMFKVTVERRPSVTAIEATGSAVGAFKSLPDQ